MSRNRDIQQNCAEQMIKVAALLCLDEELEFNYADEIRDEQIDIMLAFSTTKGNMNNMLYLEDEKKLHAAFKWLDKSVSYFFRTGNNHHAGHWQILFCYQGDWFFYSTEKNKHRLTENGKFTTYAVRTLTCEDKGAWGVNRGQRAYYYGEVTKERIYQAANYIYNFRTKGEEAANVVAFLPDSSRRYTSGITAKPNHVDKNALYQQMIKPIVEEKKIIDERQDLRAEFGREYLAAQRLEKEQEEKRRKRNPHEVANERPDQEVPKEQTRSQPYNSTQKPRTSNKFKSALKRNQYAFGFAFGFALIGFTVGVLLTSTGVFAGLGIPLTILSIAGISLAGGALGFGFGRSVDASTRSRTRTNKNTATNSEIRTHHFFGHHEPSDTLPNSPSNNRTTGSNLYKKKSTQPMVESTRKPPSVRK